MVIAVLRVDLEAILVRNKAVFDASPIPKPCSIQIVLELLLKAADLRNVAVAS